MVGDTRSLDGGWDLDQKRSSAFGDELREARTARKLNQSDLADLTKIDRTIISRLETGDRVVTLEQAQMLADATKTPHLLELATASAKKNVRYRPPAKREEVLDTLLNARPLERLAIVVADELDIVNLLRTARVNLPATVEIVVPTRQWQRQLYRTTDTADAVPSRWDVQDQINRIFEANAKEADGTRALGTKIVLYESDRITSSYVLGGSPDGSFYVFWPFFPDIEPSETLPAMVSQDSATLGLAERHLQGLREGRDPLTHLKAIVTVGPRPDEHTEAEHYLSSFFQLGEDQERSLNRPAGPLSAGFAVPLVLVHGLIPREGHRPGRRLILPMDHRSRTHALFSTHISNVDFDVARSVRNRGDGVELLAARSTSAPGVAYDKVLDRSSPTSGLVDVDVFQQAARRSILDEFGIKVPIRALEPVPLPPELWVVDKGAGNWPVIPRLFKLDVTPGLDHGTAVSASVPSGEWEAWLDSSSRLRHSFQLRRDVAVLGWKDLAASDNEFNDFIVKGRDFRGGWLIDLVRTDLTIAEY